MALVKTKKDDKDYVNKSLKTKPKTAQETLPYKRVYTNGIIEIEDGVFTKSYRVNEVDFSTAGQERQEEIYEVFCAFLNSFNADTQLQITTYNKTMDLDKFRDKVFMKGANDTFNGYRNEYNDMLEYQMSTGQNGLEQEKFYTISLRAENVDIATENFKVIDNAMNNNLKNISEEETIPMTLEERLSVLYDICHTDNPDTHLDTSAFIDGEEVKVFDYELIQKRGLTTKDIICPDGFEFSKSKYFKMGDVYGASLYLHSLPSKLKTEYIEKISNLPYNMLVSVFIEPQNQEKALKMVKRHYQNIRSNIATAQQKASENGISNDLINPDLLDSQYEAENWRIMLTDEDEKMFLLTMVITCFASTKEELEQQVELIKNTSKSSLCYLNPLTFQQEHGFVSSLPLGQCKVHADQLLATKHTGLFLPYCSYDYKQEGGRYYGINTMNNSMIILNRLLSSNFNGIIIGTSGSGKSFAVKREICAVFLGTNDDIIIIDPEREYAHICDSFKGTRVKIASGSGVHINPLDVNTNYADDENPIPLKVDFICSLYETISGLSQSGRSINPIERTILSRCVIELYKPYMTYLADNNLEFDNSKTPTLADLYNILMKQIEPEAQNIALAFEIYAVGVLDAFQKRTTVDTDNRLLVYDIKDIDAGMKELGLQIALSDAWNRITSNLHKGKRTWIYVDEAHLLVQTPNSAKLLQNIWKRARKFGGVPTAITQDVEDFIATQEGRGMFNNCDFIMMLKQSPIAQKQLGDLLSLSKEQIRNIDRVKRGAGLLYTGRTILPFKDEFPTDTKLYEMMSTDVNDLD